MIVVGGPLDEWEDGDGGGVPFLPDAFQDAAQPWRGLEHPADWPESDAGPEYWMLRGMLEAEDDDEDKEEGQ